VASSRHSAQDEFNQRTYRDSGVVEEYAGERELFTAERVILGAIESAIRGGSILDLGVGGGRTTASLLQVSGRYLGIDNSEPLIAASRRRHPGVTFAIDDARVLDSVKQELFDLVVFSFNGIDYVNHEDRLTILAQVYRRLRPGGLFWFSSHNLRTPVRKPWHLSHYQWRQSVQTTLANLKDIARNHWHYGQRAATQTAGDGYAILVDEGHEFRLVTYYVEPAEQLRQLRTQGFEGIRVFDFSGTERNADAMELDHSAHVHYIAVRPRRATSGQ
jgi:SAM-dependent methyltransferase